MMSCVLSLINEGDGIHTSCVLCGISDDDEIHTSCVLCDISGDDGYTRAVCCVISVEVMRYTRAVCCGDDEIYTSCVLCDINGGDGIHTSCVLCDISGDDEIYTSCVLCDISGGDGIHTSCVLCDISGGDDGIHMSCVLCGISAMRYLYLLIILQAIQSGILSSDLIKEASDIREELEKLAAHEETFWKQRGKALWLKEGDRNTTFFHKKASHRFRTNLISKLKNSTGAWVYEEKEIQQCIVSYFQNLFSSNNPNEDDIARGTENLRRVVDTSMEEDLLRPYSEDEVTKALFQMAPLKSPARTTTGKQGYMAMKLDVSKAYDKVEWAFLEQVMAKLGFPSSFLRLIMLFVSSVSYSFMNGGQQFGSVFPRRGLRQGDPLSPYLFLLCTESFSSLLQKAEMDGRIRGVSICRNAPYISHLLFADDTLIFSQASSDSARHIKEILEIYRMASGQEINFQKSSVAFSKNCCEEAKRAIVLELEIRTENKMELYLGLPSRAARLKKELFSSIRDKVWKRINGWNEKFLSQAGKEVLIKSVIQAIPTYAMGCFKLPMTLLREIQSLISNFWWHNRGQNKIHWISWQRLCDSKLQGGIGFRQLHLFNLAMLAKQLWRIHCFLDRLLSQVLKHAIFLTATSLKHHLADALHILGGVLWQHKTSFERDADGEWAQEHQYAYGRILGSHAH
ncbi:UNVERIFIED_CONTAM: putative mitochondrial protein [Sesamum calycinum]|uniref:Mitochondrial protein n=1 Tax=Sesamum calycinum TaxID=2727403 RepID=A0AAW2J9S3_9LAMI